MTLKRSFPSGEGFPFELFVQTAIESHFRGLGFALDASSEVDLICLHPDTSERWHIEAKGRTSQPGLDFRTCLGQLVQRMTDDKTRYGIAVPDIPEYRAQIGQTSDYAVKLLGLHWLLVSPDGEVSIHAGVTTLAQASSC